MAEEIPDQHWAAAPPELQKIRLDHAARIAETYLDMVRKQVESIAKYLLLVNAGGAAAVLAAIAQKVEFDFKLTLSSFVVGLILVGLAMATSLGIYMAGARRNAAGFTRHVNGEIDWHGYLAAESQKSWTGWDKFVFFAGTPLYWFSFAAFIVGCISGARSLWLN